MKVMRAPEGAHSANVEGKLYRVDANGMVEADDAHVATLTVHGYRPVEETKDADVVPTMDETPAVVREVYNAVMSFTKHRDVDGFVNDVRSILQANKPAPAPVQEARGEEDMPSDPRIRRRGK